MDWFIILFPLGLFGCLGLFFGAMIPFVGIIEFTIFASWWWPFRSESAATLAAAGLDIDQETTEWREHGYKLESLSNSALGVTIKSDDFDGMKLSVDGQDVPLTLWDAFKLFWAQTRWQIRHDELLRERADKSAARKARDYLKRRAAQEKAR